MNYLSPETLEAIRRDVERNSSGLEASFAGSAANAGTDPALMANAERGRLERVYASIEADNQRKQQEDLDAKLAAMGLQRMTGPVEIPSFQHHLTDFKKREAAIRSITVACNVRYEDRVYGLPNVRFQAVSRGPDMYFHQYEANEAWNREAYSPGSDSGSRLYNIGGMSAEDMRRHFEPLLLPPEFILEGRVGKMRYWKPFAGAIQADVFVHSTARGRRYEKSKGRFRTTLPFYYSNDEVKTLLAWRIVNHRLASARVPMRLWRISSTTEYHGWYSYYDTAIECPTNEREFSEWTASWTGIPYKPWSNKISAAEFDAELGKFPSVKEEQLSLWWDVVRKALNALSMSEDDMVKRGLWSGLVP